MSTRGLAVSLALLALCACSNGPELGFGGPHLSPVIPAPAVGNYCAGDQVTLPDAFTVYVRDTTVWNTPFEGSHPVTLPSPRAFDGAPGCYLACFTEDAEKGLYDAGDGAYVVGQIRVPGVYNGPLCMGMKPRGVSYPDLCSRFFEGPCEDQSCTVGRNTGGWFSC